MVQTSCKRRIDAWAVAFIVLLPAVARAGPAQLSVKIIHAHNEATLVDRKLQKLARELKPLKFRAYELLDEALFALELGATGRMQLPGGNWMTVVPREVASDGKLRVELTIEKLDFKTTVSIAKGGTLAIGGPPHGKGVLILAVTRPDAS